MKTLCIALVLAVQFPSARAADSFVAHEWGTFTSVQGADGNLLPWHPLQSSELPAFVHDWSSEGSNSALARFGPVTPGTGKYSIISLQRMETPVIYFYSDHKRTVDVSVGFPDGFVTEWYPQIDQIGPAVSAPPGSDHVTRESRIHWGNVTVSPAGKDADSATDLPCDPAGGHYFAARATDSALLHVTAWDKGATESEKFLFYRGVGNFSTPLRASLDQAGRIGLTNTGTNALSHLLLLDLRDGWGSISMVEHLEPRQSLPGIAPATVMDKTNLASLVGRMMTASLINEGLYPREAAAMVATWTDSWFAEDGMRVLYVLPRAWTDATLPMSVSPAPDNIVRVMVGRAEIITPARVQHLHDEVGKWAYDSSPSARDRVVADMKQLGRFVEPTWQLAAKGLDPMAVDFGSNTLRTLVVPGNVHGAVN